MKLQRPESKHRQPLKAAEVLPVTEAEEPPVWNVNDLETILPELTEHKVSQPKEAWVVNYFGFSHLPEMKSFHQRNVQSTKRRVEKDDLGGFNVPRNQALNLAHLRLIDPQLAHQLENRPDLHKLFSGYKLPRGDADDRILFYPELRGQLSDEQSEWIKLVDEYRCDHKMELLLRQLARIRFLDEAVFQKVLKPEDKALAKDYLRRVRHSPFHYRHGLFYCVVIFADEISVSRERGLVVKTKPSKIRPSQPMPTRLIA